MSAFYGNRIERNGLGGGSFGGGVGIVGGKEVTPKYCFVVSPVCRNWRVQRKLKKKQFECDSKLNYFE